MLVSTETQKKQRLLDLQEKDRKNASERAYKSKRTQTSPRYTLWAGNVLESFSGSIQGQQSCTLCLRKISMVPAVQL